jgi:hypothetical protein
MQLVRISKQQMPRLPRHAKAYHCKVLAGEVLLLF